MVQPSQALTEQERAGKRIYVEGESPSGRALRAIIAGGTTVAASVVPCASCHGADGLGRAEGGLSPPELIWPELMKSYGHAHENGRRHPGFDERSLARAITSGVDSGGNALDGVMPRYAISQQDLASLIAYLKILEHEEDDGVSASRIRIATVLPLDGPPAEVGRAIRDTLQEQVDEINGRGGIHGRKLELAVLPSGGAEARPLEEARQLLARDPAFALVSGLTPGAEQELSSLAEKSKLPLVGPFAPFALRADEGARFTFQLVGGMRDQSLALAQWAAREIPSGRIAVLHPADAGSAEVARAVLQRLRSRGCPGARRVEYRRGQESALVSRLRARKTDAVIFLGEDGELAAFAGEAARLGWAPFILAPGALSARASAAAPRLLEGKILLAYPARPAAESHRKLEVFATAGPRAGTRDRHAAARAFARAAAAILAEALRQTGRHLTREALVESLEKLHDFNAGLGPPLAYGPARRVGARGAYVVAVDLARGTVRPVSGWIGVE
jgi:ABC-type branched-subunit amino acid transport system substrate-binding protein